MEIPSQVNETIAPHDAMFAGNLKHYLSCGRSALTVIAAAIELAGLPPPASILDFGAGAGRVTRWLSAAFGSARISACDLRPEDMKFLRQEFGVTAWVVDRDVRALSISGRYDLIWLGSVITHLSADNTLELLTKLAGCCTDGGLIIASFHGRRAIERQETCEYHYIGPETWMLIKAGLSATGYGYADYAATPGYGISVAELPWLLELSRSLGLRLVMLGEQLWDGHHDVVAMQYAHPRA
jgi:SAM-dependent methyltransferase